MNTQKKLLKEADSKVLDAVKVLANSKASLDEAQTMLIMNLSYSFQQLYVDDLTMLNDKITEAITAVNALAKKIRIQLKQ